MTWGEIEGTPFRLDGGDTPFLDTPGPSFKIPDLPKREKLALELAEKVSQKHRELKKKAMQVARQQLSTYVLFICSSWALSTLGRSRVSYFLF